MTYFELLQKLYQVNLFGGVKLGLENILRLDQALGFPSKAMRFVHVAGTNGKGSVCTKIAKALESAGYRVGLYTSPHISCFRERIRINGKMISEEAVCEFLPPLFAIDLKPTFFEYTTMLALKYFQEEKVDFVVLETGLGGRLDATNIVTPEISVITSISLEHTEILGDTMETIAYEKAGIIKPNVTVIIGPRTPVNIFADIAKQKNSPLKYVPGTFKTFEQENCAIAKATLKEMGIAEEAISSGLKAVPPCRMEILRVGKKRVIFDVAHNPDGLTQLFKTLKEKPCILFGLSKTKDIAGCMAILKEKGSHFYPVEAGNGRGAPVTKLQSYLPTDKTFLFPSIKESMDHALHNHDLLLVCGTFFIMGEARRALHIIEPFDAIDMNEKPIS